LLEDERQLFCATLWEQAHGRTASLGRIKKIRDRDIEAAAFVVHKSVCKFYDADLKVTPINIFLS